MNKPAFPHESPKEIFAGMSLLEYYAGQVMVGFTSSPEIMKRIYQNAKAYSSDEFQIIADGCFNIAEAMIKEAEKRSK